MYRLNSQKARTSQPRKPFSGATVRIRIIIAVLPSFSHVSPHARRLAQGKDGGHERAQLPLGAWCAAMPYRGGRGKSRGCFALDKEGIPLCNRKKIRKRDRKKEKRPIERKRSLLEKKVKGKNSMNKEKRKLIGEKKREEEERKNK